MSIRLKRLISIIKNLSFDTHLWCVSVIGAAILLSLTFFNGAYSHPELSEDRNITVSGTDSRVIEYSSFLGNLNLALLDDSSEIEEYISDNESLELKGFTSVNEAMMASGVFDIDVDKRIKVEEISLNSQKYDDYPIENDFDFISGSLLGKDDELLVDNKYSISELEFLARVIQCEARSEDLEGRILIANVVLNRLKSGIWGDTIEEVLLAKGQFDPVENGAYMVIEPDDTTWEAVHRALSGEDLSEGAIYFRKAKGVWGDKEFLFQYGAHSFYK